MGTLKRRRPVSLAEYRKRQRLDDFCFIEPVPRLVSPIFDVVELRSDDDDVSANNDCDTTASAILVDVDISSDGEDPALAVAHDEDDDTDGLEVVNIDDEDDSEMFTSDDNDSYKAALVDFLVELEAGGLKSPLAAEAILSCDGRAERGDDCSHDDDHRVPSASSCRSSERRTVRQVPRSRSPPFRFPAEMALPGVMM